MESTYKVFLSSHGNCFVLAVFVQVHVARVRVDE